MRSRLLGRVSWIALASVSVSVLGLFTLACTDRQHADSSSSFDRAPSPTQSCAAEPIPERRAPDVRPALDDPEYWLAKADALHPGSSDLELLDIDERARLAATVAALPGGWRDPALAATGDPALIDRELAERRDWLRGRVDSGKYLEGQPGALAASARISETAEAVADQGSLHLVTAETPLWCVPTTAGLYTDPIDLDFDRNRCASLHMGEPLRALRRSADARWTYVDAGHSVGWIAVADGGEAALSPALDATALAARPTVPQLYILADHGRLRAGAHFPLAPDPADSGDSEQSPPAVLLPGPAGPLRAVLPEGLPHHTGPLPFTRRNLFTQAFAQLDQAYGWGGRAGQRDCSRFLHDLFAQFDVRLARNSGVQAKLGTRSVDISALDDDDKRTAIRAAAEDGVVLLYMRGHIMLYLGHDGSHDYGISALSEYLEVCELDPDAPAVVHRLDRVAVTTLELGRGTQRRAFIERISRMAVFD